MKSTEESIDLYYLEGDSPIVDCFNYRFFFFFARS